MKLTREVIVATIGDGYVAVPMTESEKDFRGIIQLNETGAMIVNCLIEGKDADEIADKILEEYENVTREKAIDAISGVVNKLKTIGLIEE